MRIIHQAGELGARDRKVCLAIGFFDGVHLGHQQIIRQTITDARQHQAVALVLTFDRHPNTVVAPGRVPPLIYSLSQKLRSIAAFGPDALLLIHFDTVFSQQSAETFIRGLRHDLGCIHSLCVGANFVFGHNRGGNVDLLKKLGAELKFTVHALAAVSLDGLPVSSTRIRAAVHDGELDAASQRLGRAYSIAGQVVRGDGLGRELGFPTANIDCSGLALPPKGVYAVHAESRPGQGSRPPRSARAASSRPARPTRYRAVLNIGERPTLSNPLPELRVEAHLLDFKGDLYSRELEVTFVERLRDEAKFPSLDHLRRQIAQDVLEAQRRL